MDDRDLRAARLREARKDAGYDSAEKAAEAFGWGASGYRHHENANRAFNTEAVRRYARAFKVNPGWLAGFEGVPKRQSGSAEPEFIEISGSVAAGVWRESMALPPEERRSYLMGPSPFPGVRRFLLRVDGLSMDLVYAPGKVLDCFSIYDLGFEPESGDDVIVERRREDGLREYTVKRFHRDEDGVTWLIPMSSQPEFQERIRVGKPDDEADTEGWVQVIAYVGGEYNPKADRLLERFRAARRR